MGRPRRDMDEYENGEFRWWHRSEPSPELVEAISDRWLTTSGWIFDVGCGQGTEAEALAGHEANVVGIDLSLPASRTASRSSRPNVRGRRCAPPPLRRRHLRSSPRPRLLPLHPCRASPRLRSRSRARTPPGSPFLPRACMTAAGIPNGLDGEQVVRTFSGWSIERILEADIPSDTRTMHAVVARMRSPE
jgi:hypothetical protein